MSIKLVAIDMDGTLLNNVCEVPKENIEAIEQAIGKGVMVVPTTGRCYKNTKNMITGEIPGISHYVTCNGAIVVDDESEEVIHEELMEKDDVKAIYDLIEKHPVFTEIYAGLNSYVDARGIRHLYKSVLPTEYCDHLLETTSEVDSLREIADDASIPVSKYHIVGETAEDITKLRHEIAAIDGLHPISLMPENIEVTAGRWSKREGLEKLIDELGIEREEVMVIGDSKNDYEMLEWASHSVAMGNADERAKELADYVTTTNNEAGVAKAIKEFVL